MRVRVLLAVAVLTAAASVGGAQDCPGSRIGGYATGGVVYSTPVSPMYASGAVIGGPVYVNGSPAPTMVTERPRYFGGMFRRRAVYAPAPMPIAPPVATTTTTGTTPVPATTSGTATTNGTTTGTTTTPGVIVSSGTTITPATTTPPGITTGSVMTANGTTTVAPPAYTYSRPFFRGRWMSYTGPTTYVSGTTYYTTPGTSVMDSGYVYPQPVSGTYFGGWRFGSRWR